VIYGAIVMTTLFESIILSFFTLYLEKNGMALDRANQVLGFSIVACLAFFYPVAQAADRWSRNKTALLCCVLAIGCAFALPLAVNTPAIWIAALLLRVGAFGLYIVALALIGDTYKGNDLVAASALVAICWGAGGMVGPPLVGSLIDGLGMAILPWVMGICYVVALLAMLANGGRITSSKLA
jgi:MFS family permease